MNYKNLLKSKKYKIGIWGTGYIGLSTMVYFSKKNIKCVGFDINKEKVRKINSGKIPLKDLEQSIGTILDDFGRFTYQGFGTRGLWPSYKDNTS